MLQIFQLRLRGHNVFGTSLCDLFEEAERKRTVKTTEIKNKQTGLSKQVKIPKDYKLRGEGQGQRPTE